MTTYRATLDVPAATLSRMSRSLAEYRRVHDRRPWQRAGTPHVQAVMVLRWFKDATDLRLLARDARVSIATAYRYVHEALAAHAPELHDVLAQGLHERWAFVCLDGSLIRSTRSSAPSQAGHDVWHSGEHYQHGGNTQVPTDPTGFPVWTSPVEPGAVHDITFAGLHVLEALYPAAAQGLPTLTDKGYTGAGIGIGIRIQVPAKGRNLELDNQSRNRLIYAARTGRARQRSAQAHLESTRASRPGPLQDRRYHSCRTRPTQTPETDPVRKPQYHTRGSPAQWVRLVVDSDLNLDLILQKVTHGFAVPIM